MDAIFVVFTWLLALFSGAILVIGISTLIAGRTVVNPGSYDFSPRDARILGAIWTTWGVSFAIYDLYGALSLGAKVLPVVFVGHWWGIFIPFLPGVVLLAGLFGQLSIVLRYEQKRRRSP